MPSEEDAPQIRRLGRDEFHEVVRTFARRLAALWPWRGLVAVARGGLVPAAILAEEFDLGLVETLCIASYDGMRRGEPRLLKGLAGPGEGWLVLDDIADSGATARLVRALLPQAHLAAVYAKPAGRPFLDSVADEVAQRVWIVFPWETSP
ncbi:MAG TPA: xanthine phosphoribosyltransferase [Stellaceae bacterium]|nr:xanthine phosphoribosyltransferase [Stellaceae bacterium]